MKPLLLASLGIALAFGVAATPVGVRLGAMSEDLRFRWRSVPESSDNLLHIDIDDASLRRIGRWPWSRTVQARLLRTLASLEPAAVAVDIEYADAAEPELLPREVAQERLGHPDGVDLDDLLVQPDAELVDAIWEAGCVHLAYHFETDPESPARSWEEGMVRALRADLTLGVPELAERLGKTEAQIREGFDFTRRRVVRDLLAERFPDAGADGTGLDAPGLVDGFLSGEGGADRQILRLLVESEIERFRASSAVVRASEVGTDGSVPAEERPSMVPPLPAFVEAARGVGFVDIRVDPDGVLRKIPLFVLHQGRLVPNLVLGLWMDGRDGSSRLISAGKDGVVAVPRRPPAQGAIMIPIDAKGRATIDWADDGSPDRVWETHLGPHLPCAALFDLWELRELVVQGMRELHRGIGDRATEEWLVSYGDFQEQHRRALGERSRAGCDAAGLALRNRIGEAAGVCARVRAQMAGVLAGDSPAARQGEAALLKVETRALRERDLAALLRAQVEGKTCFLGAVYSAGTDFRATPTRAAFPGVAVHSHLLDMLQRERFVRHSAAWVKLVSMVAAGLLAAWAAMRLQAGAGGTLLAACAGAYAGALAFLFGRGGWMGPMAAPLLALGLNYTVLTAYRQLTTEKDRRRIRKMFELYLSPSVIVELEKHPEMLRLGGEEREITSYFSDIKSFTPIAEGMSSPELVELLRDYFDRMTHVVLSHDGTLDKYVGDAIVAIWGAPITQEDHALRAVRTALESQAALAGLREWLRVEGKPPLFMRIGINTGKAVVGNMGSSERFNYTALGDTVNLASRLEGANKPFGTWILIGPGTHQAVRSEIACRRVARLVVLGRSQPVWAYEPIAPEAGLPPERRAWLDTYHQALDQYVKGDLALARTMFDGVLAQVPDDGPSRFYRDECVRLAGTPLPDGWDGRVVLDAK